MEAHRTIRRNHQATPAHAMKRYRWLATLALGVLSALTVVGLVIAWNGERRRALAATSDTLALLTEEPSSSIADRVHVAARNVLFLAKLPPIQGIVRAKRSGTDFDSQERSPIALWKDRLARIFRGYLEANPDVAQLRYIGVDDGGRELVRAHRRGRVEVVPDVDLQEKNHRPYFRRTVAKAPGTVVVSSIHLNREHGRVSEPHQPMLHVSTPIHDQRGVIFGLIVINIDAGRLLETALSPSTDSLQLYVLNPSGDFVAHPNPKHTFAHDLKHNHVFANEFVRAASHDFGPLTAHLHDGHIEYVRSQRVALDPSRADVYVDVIAAAPQHVVAAGTHAGFVQDVIIILVATGVTVLLLGVGWLKLRHRLQVQNERVRLAAIVDHSTDAIIGVDLQGTIIDWNHSAACLLGYSNEEAVGVRVDQVLKGPGPDHESLTLNWTAGTAGSHHKTCTRKDGTSFDSIITASPVIQADGVLSGTALLLRDVTEENRYHEKLLQLNRDLESEVAARTRRLDQARMEAENAREEAEAASQAKGQFLANMTHEIRTPMNAVLGSLQLLRGATLSASEQRYAKTAEVAAETLLRTLNDILDYSKIEAGKLRLHEEDIHLHKLLRDVGAVLSANVGSKPVDIAFDLDPDLPQVIRGDSLRLQQVLLNLAGNAIKFTEHGHVLLAVRAEQRVGSHVGISFSVLDTGIGMSDEQQQRIFDGFEQADGTTARRFGGSGLGLSISRHLAQLMGGKLGVESSLGCGSQFRFEAPFVLPSHPQQAITAAPLQRLQQASVLLISRPSTPRDTVAVTMRSFGWDVQMVDEVAEGTALCTPAKTRNYDVVLLDSHGYAAANLAPFLKLFSDGSHEVQKKLVILSTVYGQHQLLTAIPSAERYTFLLKPATRSQLFDVVASACIGPYRTAQDAPQRAAQRLSGLRLLLADDNRMNQDIARDLLMGEGAHVTVVNDGAAAVAHLREQPNAFDLILMDINMPNMDGYRTTEYIRKELQLSLQRLPIVAMTANATTSDRLLCLARGMNDHVAKPMYLDQLVNTILNCTRTAQRAPTETPAHSPAEHATEPQVVDFDFAGAETRFGGNLVVWERSIVQFLATHAAANHPFPRVALGTSDPHKAATWERFCHTLKSNAASLGAVQLAKRAGALETALQDTLPQHDLQRRLAELRRALDAATPALRDQAKRLRARQELAKGTDANGGAHVDIQVDPKAETDDNVDTDTDTGAALAKLAMLESEVQRQSIEAIGIHKSLHPILRRLVPELASDLQSAMGKLDFVDAEQTCKTIRRELCA